MRIGVISDTHVQSFVQLPEPLRDALTEVDIIIHAGDFTEKEVLEGLKKITEVKAVCGNMDSSELKRMLPQQELFVVRQKKIGIVHGSGAPQGIEQRVRQAFSQADIIVFGHSHQSCNQIIGGSLLFNPGRARDSFGILTIDDEVRAEIVKLS